MVSTTAFQLPNCVNPIFSRKSKHTRSPSLPHPPTRTSYAPQLRSVKRKSSRCATITGILGAGLALTIIEPASAADLLLLGQLSEPANALSLPTWAIHVSSVVEWITAMALVWQYGEKSGFESWKGLSWGMFPGNSLLMVTATSLTLLPYFVPLLGGAFCACTWHFFYNAESLEVLVALQAALTVIGNVTMCIAAYRIYKSSSEERPKNL